MFRPSRLFARAGGPQWTAVVCMTGLVTATGWPLPAQEPGDESAQDGADEGTKPAGDAGRNAAWTKIEQDAEKGYREPLKTGGGFEAAARDFVTKKAMPQLANEANRLIIDRVRRKMREILVVGITDDRAFDDASKAVADAAVAIARNPEASTAARVNAMLLVGELRAKDNKDGTVWPAAVTQLAAVAGDATIDPSVRVAAMAGLVRHADVAKRTGGDRLTDFAKGARSAILAIVAEKPSADQPLVSDWLASRALSILTAVVKSSPKELAATLAGVMNDTSRSLDVRVRAASALGATVTPKSEIQAVETTNGVTELAVAVLEVDEGILRDRRYEQQMGGGGAGNGGGGGGGMMSMRPAMGMPGMGGGGGAVTQLVPDQSLRRTAWRLVTLADAVLTEDGKGGVAALLSGDDKAASQAYAELYRKYGLELDEKRTDDVILEALSALRPGDEVEEAALPAGETEGAPAKPADDNDPFGSK
ncbi:MAG: hypothetical protein WCJ31_09505 [Planctomycetia bacterium]